jgi:hypothetical protein
VSTLSPRRIEASSGSSSYSRSITPYSCRSWCKPCKLLWQTWLRSLASRDPKAHILPPLRNPSRCQHRIKYLRRFRRFHHKRRDLKKLIPSHRGRSIFHILGPRMILFQAICSLLWSLARPQAIRNSSPQASRLLRMSPTHVARCGCGSSKAALNYFTKRIFLEHKNQEFISIPLYPVDFDSHTKRNMRVRLG